METGTTATPDLNFTIQYSFMSGGYVINTPPHGLMLRNKSGAARVFKTRDSAHKAVTRLRRQILGEEGALHR